MAPGVPSRTAETDAKLLLAENLKLIRAAAGFTSAAALGRQIQAHESVIAKAETGERPPTPEVMQRLLEACRVTGLHRTALEGIWRLARGKDGPIPVKVAPWFETEARAHTLRYWAPLIVPGLVQTPAYARELFAAMSLDDATVKEFLEVRLGRQAIIKRSDPPDITIVLWEPVLHHQIGTPEIMREQIGRLVDLSQWSD
jgi:transcriptional regulator with XRE-family HTH domain